MKNYKVLSLLLLAVMLTAAACHKSNDIDPVANRDKALVYKDVLYATDTQQQVMDVYLPANRDADKTPVVILIHGGGWRDGDKNDFDNLGLYTFFTSRGWAVVNMNYRLDSKYAYPAPIFDIGQAMECIKQKSVEWGVNPNRVCLFGRSAGAHLALTFAYCNNKDGRVKAVIDGYGPTNFVDSSVRYNKNISNIVDQLLGVYTTNETAWVDASPLFNAEHGVPTVIFQGTEDSVVHYKQATMLRDSLLQHGIPCMFVTWTGYGHGWTQEKWQEWQIATYEWVKRFL